MNKKTQKNAKSTSGKDESKQKDKGGRPTKLTDQVIEDFSTAVSIGSTYKLASMYAKISEESASLWLRLGRLEYMRRESGDPPIKKNERYLRFLMAVRDAETDAGISWQKVVNSAAKSDPNWSLKMLRLRFGQGYMENDATANVQIPEDMTVPFLDRIIAGENPVEVIKDWKEYCANTSGSPTPQKD